jgi:putative nucleotidyltransferase with HDIG domain
MTIARLSLAANLVQETGLRALKRVYVRGRDGHVVLVAVGPVKTEAVLTALANQEAQLGQVLERMAQTATETDGDDVRTDSEERYTVALSNATARLIMEALDKRIPGHQAHAENVQEVAVRLARLLGEDEALIAAAAYYHDIGKMGVSDRVLLKAGPLCPHEREEISHHPELGASLMASLGYAEIAHLVRDHHVAWNTDGRLPRGVQIISVADSYDAMITPRIYRVGGGAMTRRQAIEELRRCAGTQFAPGVVAAFLQILERHV